MQHLPAVSLLPRVRNTRHFTMGISLAKGRHLAMKKSQAYEVLRSDRFPRTDALLPHPEPRLPGSSCLTATGSRRVRSSATEISLVEVQGGEPAQSCHCGARRSEYGTMLFGSSGLFHGPSGIRHSSRSLHAVGIATETQALGFSLGIRPPTPPSEARCLPRLARERGPLGSLVMMTMSKSDAGKQQSAFPGRDVIFWETWQWKQPREVQISWAPKTPV